MVRGNHGVVVVCVDSDRNTMVSMFTYTLLAVALSTPEVAAPPAIPDITMVPAIRGRSYREPVQVLSAPDDSDSIIVVERSGRVIKAPLSEGEDELMLDLRGNVSTRNSEEGLLSIAFDPAWKTTGACYVYRSLQRPRRTVLSRFTRASESWKVDPDSEEVLLTINQPYGNHNGGTILFGPDGMLYLSVGDGGSANDPHGAGQDMKTFLGKILRIDVSGEGEGAPYRVPPDNPFIGQEGVKSEIWATGLRNVWRMSFDEATGALWAGDVGQNAWEEIDIIHRGGNYGWNLREGRHEFRPSGESTGVLIDPVIEYGRNKGGSVTGGVVYRGAAYPSLQGVYFYGDYMSGRLWGAIRDSDGTIHTRELKTSRRVFPSSFGTGPSGEVLVCAFAGPYQRSGEILRIQPKEPARGHP